MNILDAYTKYETNFISFEMKNKIKSKTGHRFCEKKR